MKNLVSFFFLLLLLLVALVTQDLLSGSIGPYQAHLFFVPLVFCLGVLVLPFPLALLFGLITAVLEGLMVLQFQHDRVEIGLGWFIFFFMAWSLLLQFVSDLINGIRWELYALGSALCTATFLLGELLLVCCNRGHFSLTGTAIVFILVPSAGALFMAPLFYYLLQFLLPPVRTIRPAGATV